MKLTNILNLINALCILHIPDISTDFKYNECAGDDLTKKSFVVID